MKYEYGTSLGLLLLFPAHTIESERTYDEHNTVKVEVRLWSSPGLVPYFSSTFNMIEEDVWRAQHSLRLSEIVDNILIKCKYLVKLWNLLRCLAILSRAHSKELERSMMNTTQLKMKCDCGTSLGLLLLFSRLFDFNSFLFVLSTILNAPHSL